MLHLFSSATVHCEDIKKCSNLILSQFYHNESVSNHVKFVTYITQNEFSRTFANHDLDKLFLESPQCTQYIDIPRYDMIEAANVHL